MAQAFLGKSENGGKAPRFMCCMTRASVYVYLLSSSWPRFRAAWEVVMLLAMIVVVIVVVVIVLATTCDTFDTACTRV